MACLVPSQSPMKVPWSSASRVNVPPSWPVLQVEVSPFSSTQISWIPSRWPSTKAPPMAAIVAMVRSISVPIVPKKLPR